MTRRTRAKAVRTEAKRLAQLGSLPKVLSEHEVMTAMAALCIASRADCTVAVKGNSLDATIGMGAFSEDSPVMSSLMDSLEKNVVAQVLYGNGPFSSRSWIDDYDYTDFILQSIALGVAETGRYALLVEVATAAAALGKKAGSLSLRYQEQLVARDLPELTFLDRRHSKERFVWVLAVAKMGQPNRSEIITRRFRALTTFAAVSHLVCEKPMTDIVDQGGSLLPMIAEVLDLDKASARSLIGARPVNECLSGYNNGWKAAIAELAIHEVPLKEWPAQGAPNNPQAWKESCWLNRNIHSHSSYLRWDYHGSDPSRQADATKGFLKDILTPLIMMRLDDRSYPKRGRARLWPMLPQPYASSQQASRKRHHLRLIRKLLVGERTPAAFGKAVDKWHRRAAAVAALRMDSASESPGWVGLCEPWTSECGHYTITALTTAVALIENGNTHQHCVGSYYEICRSGDTQILSLDKKRVPKATIEVLLGSDLKNPSLRIGQFKGRDDAVAEQHLHPVLRAFLHDVRTLKHPLKLKDLAAYRKQARKHEAPSSEVEYTMEMARTAFPLYVALLSNNTPRTLDAWLVKSGAIAAIDLMLDAVIEEEASAKDKNASAAA